jgi:ACS family hexuronate transporter-like MFS transporter
VVAGPLIAWVLLHANWLGLASWRWVFFLTGALGLIWVVAWSIIYRTPQESAGQDRETEPGPVITVPMLLRRRQILGVASAKFLSDAAWYFYLFWLPKYLFDALHFDIARAGSVGWIPYAASGVGCIIGGGLSSYLLRRGASVNLARKAALGASAALMPWVMMVPHSNSVPLVLLLFSLAFFGQQSWSTLVMILPTDLVPRRALGKFAGLVGMGGAFGGVVFQQFAGWMLDHGYSYAPVLAVAASLHVIAFALICIVVPKIELITFQEKHA